MNDKTGETVVISVVSKDGSWRQVAITATMNGDKRTWDLGGIPGIKSGDTIRFRGPMKDGDRMLFPDLTAGQETTHEATLDTFNYTTQWGHDLSAILANDYQVE